MNLPPHSFRLVLALGTVVLASCAVVPVPPPPPPAPSPQPGAPAPTPEVSCSNPWRGYVVASDHNYAGIGAFNGSNRFMCKATPTQGIRAHLQHLRNYADSASTPSTLGAPFEPRPFYTEANFGTFLYHGAAPRWIDLNGRWAVPGTTYAQTFVGIYNTMRANVSLPPVDVSAVTIMGPSELTAAQIAARVCASINCADWKPEISPTAMAQLYIDEGILVGVRGDLAFCQSILETGWFRWPGSPTAIGLSSAGTAEPDPVMDVYFELQSVTGRN